MKGYKGFAPGLICKGKQYAENMVFEEDRAEICKKGMHFCKDPFDVLDYYPLINDKVEFNDFAEVETLDEVLTDNGKKFCTKKLKIGAKLNLAGFINACVGFLLEKVEPEKILEKTSKLAASGRYSKLAASGYASKLAAAGDESKLAASGYASKLAASGDKSTLAASGNSSQLAASGHASKLAASSNYSKLAASGYASQLAASGHASKLAASGHASQLAAFGNSSQLAASGHASKLECTGEDSVIVCAGHNCKAKAKLGCWITLAEWSYSAEKQRHIPVCVKTEYVDGERIKADAWYSLQNGKFVEGDYT